MSFDGREARKWMMETTRKELLKVLKKNVKAFRKDVFKVQEFLPEENFESVVDAASERNKKLLETMTSSMRQLAVCFGGELDEDDDESGTSRCGASSPMQRLWKLFSHVSASVTVLSDSIIECDPDDVGEPLIRLTSELLKLFACIVDGVHPGDEKKKPSGGSVMASDRPLSACGQSSPAGGAPLPKPGRREEIVASPVSPPTPLRSPPGARPRLVNAAVAASPPTDNIAPRSNGSWQNSQSGFDWASLQHLEAPKPRVPSSVTGRGRGRGVRDSSRSVVRVGVPPAAPSEVRSGAAASSSDGSSLSQSSWSRTSFLCSIFSDHAAPSPAAPQLCPDQPRRPPGADADTAGLAAARLRNAAAADAGYAIGERRDAAVRPWARPGRAAAAAELPEAAAGSGAYPFCPSEEWRLCIVGEVESVRELVVVDLEHFRAAFLRLWGVYDHRPANLRLDVPPTLDQLVVAEIPGTSHTTWSRGRVKDVSGANSTVRIFAFDLGLYVTVPWSRLWKLDRVVQPGRSLPLAGTAYRLPGLQNAATTQEVFDLLEELVSLNPISVSEPAGGSGRICVMWDCVTKVDLAHLITSICGGGVGPRQDLNKSFSSDDYLLFEAAEDFDEVLGAFPADGEESLFEPGVTKRVYVCNVGSVSDFHVVEEEKVDEYFRFLEKMQVFYSAYLSGMDLDRNLDAVRRLGLMEASYRVAYKFGRFYRVCVLNEVASGEPRGPDEISYACRTLDYGVEFEVSVKDLFPLHRDFALMPPAVVHCCLDVAEEDLAVWTDFVRIVSNYYMIASLFEMRVLEVGGVPRARKYTVQLKSLDERKGSFGEDILDLLDSDGDPAAGAGPVPEDESVRRFRLCQPDTFDVDLSDLDSVVTGKSASSRGEEDAALGRMCRFADIGKSCPKSFCTFRHDFVSSGETVAYILTAETAPRIPGVHVESIVKVLCVESLVRFYVEFPHGPVDCHRTDEAGSVAALKTSLKSKMHDLYGYDDGCLKMGLLPNVGELVVVKNMNCSEEIPDQWLRAVVGNVFESGVQVRLLDYGVQVVFVSFKHCRLWKQALCEYPARAVECTLHGLSASDKAASSEVNIERLSNLPREYQVLARVKDVFEDGTRLSVELRATKADAAQLRSQSCPLITVFDKLRGRVIDLKEYS